MDYYDNLDREIKEYFSILTPVFPEWLLEYIATPEMKRIGKISMNCGVNYSNCFKVKWYSNLDHSIGVALIIWNFTHDKKQTLAGLFHDIATPVFKHCIDFMNGDFEVQESTEERTVDIIKNSKEIMALLKKDGIKLEEVSDYKIYPIADNATPKLSADRLEYNFSGGLTFFRVWELDKIRQVYNNIVVLENEEGILELGFKDKDIGEMYIHTVSRLWREWVSDTDRTVMQFLADMCKSMNHLGYLSIDDLYTLSEEEVINRFLSCDDTYLANSFKKFQEAQYVYKSDNFVKGKYCVNIKAKARYIIPLVFYEGKTIRINKVSEEASNEIEAYLNYPKGGYYTYFDFEFTPYK